MSKVCSCICLFFSFYRLAVLSLSIGPFIFCLFIYLTLDMTRLLICVVLFCQSLSKVCCHTCISVAVWLSSFCQMFLLHVYLCHWLSDYNKVGYYVSLSVFGLSLTIILPPFAFVCVLVLSLCVCSCTSVLAASHCL